MMGTLRPFGRTFLTAIIFAAALQARAVNRVPAAVASAAEQLLLRQANSDRVERDLPQLKVDAALASAARFHAEQMVAHADISHGFPGEPDLSVRGAKAGLRFSLITENVAEAGDASVIHDLWMHSPGHRANLLDPQVNVVGIAVICQGDAVFAVEDFASTVADLSLDEQENTVSQLLMSSGMKVSGAGDGAVQNARTTCSMEAGYAGSRQPWLVLRYTSSTLGIMPAKLQARLASGRYHEAIVGACAPQETTPFSQYNIAVLLYP